MNKQLYEQLSIDMGMPMKAFMVLGMKNLEICFHSAKATGAKYVGVLIETDGFSKPEIVINSTANFDSKLDYYMKTYDENLKHRQASGINIVGFTSGDSFAEIEGLLIE